eukprot:TRINITY_DN63608_c0_g1_i1.p1 TRINITY_DN63608_c0_g1~~TRINITY_DN63608_c0_g1_i1.p1  ORF type:complete len:100 (+),score=14.41 TRINITY_DN63608_c0_g1_i1:39-302(+)
MLPVSRALLILLLVTVVTHDQVAQAQNCTTELVNLSPCAPYAIPGSTSPSPQCCSSIKAVDHNCLCNTINIVSKLPALCSLPPITCG